MENKMHLKGEKGRIQSLLDSRTYAKSKKDLSNKYFLNTF